MNSPVTESELKAHSTAPRVTKEALDANISCVNYINVGRTIAQQNQPDHPSHHLLTLCILVLKNGFTVVGESACASAENFDEGIGQRLAYADAEKKVWPLMGYALRDLLAHGWNGWHEPAEKAHLAQDGWPAPNLLLDDGGEG